MMEYSKKVQKPCFWAIFDYFWSFIDRDFFQKLCHTQLYMSQYCHAKFQKKLMFQFWENLQTDRRMHRRIDRRTDGPFWSRPGVQVSCICWYYCRMAVLFRQSFVSLFIGKYTICKSLLFKITFEMSIWCFYIGKIEKLMMTSKVISCYHIFCYFSYFIFQFIVFKRCTKNSSNILSLLQSQLKMWMC